VVATSSSIFIASPILLFLGDWRERKRTLADREATATPAS
jgi:SecD/SecF fusion protein